MLRRSEAPGGGAGAGLLPSKSPVEDDDVVVFANGAVVAAVADAAAADVGVVAALEDRLDMLGTSDVELVEVFVDEVVVAVAVAELADGVVVVDEAVEVEDDDEAAAAFFSLFCF